MDEANGSGTAALARFQAALAALLVVVFFLGAVAARSLGLTAGRPAAGSDDRPRVPRAPLQALTALAPSPPGSAQDAARDRPSFPSLEAGQLHSTVVPSGSAAYVCAADDDLAGPGLAFEARCEVDGVADRRVLAPARRPRHADASVARVHPDAEARPVGVARRDAAGRFLEGEPGPGCPQRVVRLVAAWVERGHHGVADQLATSPSFAADRGDSVGEVLGEHRVDVSGPAARRTR